MFFAAMFAGRLDLDLGVMLRPAFAFPAPQVEAGRGRARADGRTPLDLHF